MLWSASSVRCRNDCFSTRSRGRISGQRQFREDDDLRSSRFPSSRKIQDLRTITVQISNRVINLGDGNTHESSFYRRASIVVLQRVVGSLVKCAEHNVGMGGLR